MKGPWNFLTLWGFLASQTWMLPSHPPDINSWLVKCSWQSCSVLLLVPEDWLDGWQCWISCLCDHQPSWGSWTWSELMHIWGWPHHTIWFLRSPCKQSIYVETDIYQVFTFPTARMLMWGLKLRHRASPLSLIVDKISPVSWFQVLNGYNANSIYESTLAPDNATGIWGTNDVRILLTWLGPNTGGRLGILQCFLHAIVMNASGRFNWISTSFERLLMIWLVAGLTTLIVPSRRPTHTSVPSSVYLRLKISPPHSIEWRMRMFPSATGPKSAPPRKDLQCTPKKVVIKGAFQPWAARLSWPYTWCSASRPRPWLGSWPRSWSCSWSRPTNECLTSDVVTDWYVSYKQPCSSWWRLRLVLGLLWLLSGHSKSSSCWSR